MKLMTCFQDAKFKHGEKTSSHLAPGVAFTWCRNTLFCLYTSLFSFSIGFSPQFCAGRSSSLHKEAGAATACVSGTNTDKSPGSSHSE